MPDDILAWLQFAIDIERKGLEFYRYCKDKIKDQRAALLFDKLIVDETNHERVLVSVLEKKAGGDKDKIKESIEKFNRLRISHDMFSREALEQMTDKKTMVMDLFNIAAGMEKKGISIYLDLEDQTKDQELKALFHDLARQELGHRKSIEALGLHMFGMEPEEELTPEKVEKELKSSRTVLKEITIVAKECAFEPDTIEIEKGDTLVLKVSSKDYPAGFKMISFGIDEYVSPKKDVIVKIHADTAGEFDFFSNVPCKKGNSKMRGKVIVKGENEEE